MMAGGSDRVVKAAAVRRPSIRPKPVTPPRAAAPARAAATWTLPPVRTPEVRAPKRPVLALVGPDESLDDVATDLPSFASAPSPSPWLPPRSVALAVAAVLAAAFATTAIVWTAIARRDAAEVTEAVGTTTLASASLPLTASPALTAEPDRPAIPVVDVNSLPSAPSLTASGAPR